MKDYEQYCPVAAGLAQVGDRWTLCIIRDLLFGPLRYSDLQMGQPGIGTNLLASRLKQLQASGIVVKRQLPPPAASTVYELTELGRGLQPVVLAMARWGTNFLAQHAPDESIFFQGLRSRASFAAPSLPATPEEYEFVIDGHPIVIRVGPGLYEIDEGPAAAPLARLILDAYVLVELFLAGFSLAEIEAQGLATVEGDHEACERALNLFRLQPFQATSSSSPASAASA